MSYMKLIPDDLMEEFKEWCNKEADKYFDEYLTGKSYHQVFMRLKENAWGRQRSLFQED